MKHPSDTCLAAFSNELNFHFFDDKARQNYFISHIFRNYNRIKIGFSKSSASFSLTFSLLRKVASLENKQKTKREILKQEDLHFIKV